MPHNCEHHLLVLHLRIVPYSTDIPSTYKVNITMCISTDVRQNNICTLVTCDIESQTTGPSCSIQSQHYSVTLTQQYTTGDCMRDIVLDMAKCQTDNQVTRWFKKCLTDGAHQHKLYIPHTVAIGETMIEAAFSTTTTECYGRNKSNDTSYKASHTLSYASAVSYNCCTIDKPQLR